MPKISRIVPPPPEYAETMKVKAHKRLAGD
jgi:hypothetical protein